MTIDYDQIKKDVDAFLSEIGVSFNAVLVGETVRDNWKCDEFKITFTRGEVTITTAYYMGIGHRKPVKGAPADKGTKNTLCRVEWDKRYLRPVLPQAGDVLHSLLLDAQAIDNSFVDWASDYGYDTDSRKALATYDACCSIGKDIRKLFTGAEREKLGELLQDF